MYTKIKSLIHNDYYSFWGRFESRKQGNRFVIFAQGRSGSTALRSLLTNHPEVICEGELLASGKFWPIDFVEGKAHRYNEIGKVWKFKLKR